MKLNWRKMAAHAVVTATALAAGSAFAADLKEVRFGVEASYAPFEYKTPDGKLAGFDIDVGNAVCAKLKVKCVWVENSFDGLIAALNAKKFDFIDSAMNITDKRKQTINFTSAIYHVPSQMIARRGSHLQPTAESLAGKSVGVLQGSTQEDYAHKHWASAGVKVVSYADQNQIYPDLVSGRLDAAVQETPTAIAGFLSRSEGKDFELTGNPLSDPATLGVGVGFGLRKQDLALKTRIDRALDTLKKDGTLARLSLQYFKTNIIVK